MIKEELKNIEKVWGEEIWLVNRPEYCGKLLILHRNAHSSYHSHKVKTETFTCLEGFVRLIVDGKRYMLHPFCRSKTIFPGEKHKFIGLTDSIMLETSTYHSDEDVERFSESVAGKDDFIN